MWADTLAVVRAAHEAFTLAGPVYEFGAAPRRALIEASGGQAVDPPGEKHPSRRYLTDGLHELADLPYADGAATTVLCLNILDRVPDPGRVIGQMERILRPGGTLIVCMSDEATGPASVPRYWQPSPTALQSVLGGLGGSVVGWQGAEGDPHTLFAVAAKDPVRLGFAQGVAQFIQRLDAHLGRAAAAVPWSHRAARWLARCLADTPPQPGDRDYYRVRFLVHLPVDAEFQREMLDACLAPGEVGTRVDLSP